MEIFQLYWSFQEMRRTKQEQQKLQQKHGSFLKFGNVCNQKLISRLVWVLGCWCSIESFLFSAYPLVKQLSWQLEDFLGRQLLGVPAGFLVSQQDPSFHWGVTCLVPKAVFWIKHLTGQVSCGFYEISHAPASVHPSLHLRILVGLFSLAWCRRQTNRSLLQGLWAARRDATPPIRGQNIQMFWLVIFLKALIIDLRQALVGL